MDWLRSCYKTKMVFRLGDPPVDVQWFFAEEPPANFFPGWHSFPSSNWREPGFGKLGEQQAPRPYKKGARWQEALGDVAAAACALDLAPAFTEGLASMQTTGPFDPSGLPTCCSTGGPPAEKVPCPACIPEGVPRSLTATFRAQGVLSCPCLDGVSVPLTYRGNMHDFAIPYWSGRVPTPCGCDVNVCMFCTGAMAISASFVESGSCDAPAFCDDWQLVCTNGCGFPNNQGSVPPVCGPPFSVDFDIGYLDDLACSCGGSCSDGFNIEVRE